MPRYLVTGATGLVGRRLVQALLGRGDQVTVMTRQEASAHRLFGKGVLVLVGDPASPSSLPLLRTALTGAAGCVHLAGANLFDHRWSKREKERLWSSRVASTQQIVAAFKEASTPPPVLIVASAVGYYGLRRDEVVTEDASPGDDFLARLCAAWEAAAAAPDVRVLRLRLGIVLDRDGGALAKLAQPFRLGLGGPVGDGQQGVSWIHHADLTSLILKGLDSDMQGAVNATAPGWVTNRELSQTLARLLHRPCLLTVPKFALRLAFGEVGDVMAGGQKARPERLLRAGFTFKYPELRPALADLLSRSVPRGAHGAT